MKQSQQLLYPKRRAISTPLSLSPMTWGRPDDGVYTGGCRTLTASDKSCFVGASRNTTRIAGVDFWLSAWIYPTSVSGTQMLFSDIADNNDGIYIYLNGAKVVFGSYATSSTSNVEITSTSSLTAGTWYCVTVTADRDGNGVIYLNGVSDKSQSISSLNALSLASDVSGYPTIGARVGNTNYWFAGSIASIAYGEGYVPTAADVTALYNKGNALTYAEVEARGGSLATSLLSNASRTGFYYNCNEQDPTAGLIDQAGSLDLTRTAAELLTNGNMETRTGVTGASFAAGDKAHLEAASAAAFNLGTGDAVGNSNLLRTSAGTTQVICGKYQNTSNYWWFYVDTSNYLRFESKVGGSTIIKLIASTTALSSTSTKYHVQFALDRSNVNNCKMYVNGTSQSFSTATIADDTTSLDNTGKFFVGQYGGGSSYFDGRIAMLGIGKPADVTAAAVATAITNTAGSSGLGQYYNEQSSADKTALAWSVFYDLTEASGTRRNFVNPGTNDLSEVLTSELVTNGTFAAASDWTSTFDGAGAGISGGTFNAIQSGDNDPTWCYVQQQLALTSGRSYKISYATTKNSGTVPVVVRYADNTLITAAGYDSSYQSNSFTATDVVFIPTTSNGYIGFRSGNNTGAIDWDFDNVSVKAASIPCSSDADVLGSWTETYAAPASVDIETVNYNSSPLSCRLVSGSSVKARITQAVLTVGNRYTYSVSARNTGSGELTVYVGADGVSTHTDLTTSFATKTGTVTCLTNTTFYLYNNTTGSTTILVDTASCKSAAIAVGNGPSEALATDSSGNGYHGTFVGVSASGLVTNWDSRVPTPLASQGGYAFTFDGVDDAVVLPSDPVGTGADTIACWMKINGAHGGTYGRLFDNARTLFYSDGTKLTFSSDGATSANSAANSATSAMGWLHVAATRKADGTANIYINGALSGTANQASGTPTAATQNAVIGNLYNYTRGFNGVIDDFRIYNSELSAAQIAQLYAGSEATGATPVGWWKFDDGPFGVPSDGDPVWGWESQASDRAQFVNATAANRPVQRVAAINGHQAVEGDGTSDYLRVASVFAPNTFAVVCQVDDAILASPAIQTLLAVQDEASVNNFLHLSISADGKATFQGNNAGTAFTVTGNTVLTDTGRYIITARWDGANWQLEVNKVAQTETRTGTEVASVTGADSTTLFARYSNATASNWFDGKIAEYFLGNLSVYQLGQLTRRWKVYYAI